MEKDILKSLHRLTTEARRKLAKVRRKNREESRKMRTVLMSQHLTDRLAGVYTTPEAELFIINKILDYNDMDPKDRKSFSQRRRKLIQALTNPKK
jgi:hypothetical protein